MPLLLHTQLLPLPEPFDKALNAKRESVKDLKAAIAEAGLEGRARAELQRAVSAHFRVRVATSWGEPRSAARIVCVCVCVGRE
jgi:hypothetical protein